FRDYDIVQLSKFQRKNKFRSSALNHFNILNPTGKIFYYKKNSNYKIVSNSFCHRLHSPFKINTFWLSIFSLKIPKLPFFLEKLKKNSSLFEPKLIYALKF
ncbi:hypothetical protein BpHYR1_041537, partial [Brachionus plicatilis]